MAEYNDKGNGWKGTTFFAGKLNLDEQPQGQYVLPMTLQHGIARFDLLMRAGGAISIKSITLKNLAQASYLISQDEVRSLKEQMCKICNLLLISHC